jgi:hypothetical protein
VKASPGLLHDQMTENIWRVWIVAVKWLCEPRSTYPIASLSPPFLCRLCTREPLAYLARSPDASGLERWRLYAKVVVIDCLDGSGTGPLAYHRLDSRPSPS